MPAHWSFERTKWRFRNRKELNAGGAHTNILSLTLRGVVNNNPDDPEGLVPKDYRTYQFFAKGDLVFKLIDLENLRTSRVGLVHEDGIMSSAYVRLAPSSPTNIRYFFHQFYDLYSRGIYNQLGAGVRSTLSPSDLLNVGIIIPPPLEQAAIVRFLDWANGRLERTIRAKRKVIALLNEQKQAIIHRAVTRGLDPSVPFKPSGISWLGDIPQHWEIVRFKTYIGLQEGPGIMLADFRERGIPLLRISCLANEPATLNGCNYLDPHKVNEKWSHFAVRNGDYLLSASGSTGTVRRTSTEVVGAIPYTGIIRLWAKSERVQMEYARMFMASRLFQNQIEMAKSGVGIEHFGPTHLKRMWICLPPAAEQVDIVLRAKEQAAPINTAISRLEREIDLLREYRSRLVADVVTGKLDVREVAARLPDEVAPDTTEEVGDLSDETEPADEEAAV